MGPKYNYGSLENPPYYVTAYGIAVKHGYQGTEEEWINEIQESAHDSSIAAAESAEAAAGSADTAEAFGAGTRGGEPLDEDDPAYHNNAQYYSDHAEAYGAGTRGGEPVEEDDPAYHNNAQYFAGQAQATADGLDARLDAQETAIATIRSQVASPYVIAATGAAMTDQTKAYVYVGDGTGDDAGLVNGAWYYYDADAEEWTLGGTATDPTLSVAGAAADAKATGELKSNITQIGNFLYEQTAVKRNLVTTVTAKQGDVIYCELLEWNGESFTQGQLIGLRTGQTNETFGRLYNVGESGFFTALNDYDGISFALNATIPATPKTLKIRLLNLSSINDFAFIFSKVRSLERTSFLLTQTGAVNSTTLPDADNAPVNTVIGIYNTGTAIEHLPEQIGTLVTYSYNRNTNANFEIQLFFSVNTAFYHRIKTNNAWNPWVSENATLTRRPFSNIPLASDPYKIVLLGDSITQGQGSSGYVSYNHTVDGVTYSVRGNGPDYPSAGSDYQVGQYLYAADTRIWYEALNGHGWGQLLKEYLESKFNCVVKNYGMSGISSNNLIGFLNDLVLTSDFDCVILMIGANDRNQTSSTSAFYNNVVSAARAIRNAGKELIIMAGTPTSIASEESARFFHMEDVEHVLMKIATELSLPFISVYEEFMDYCDLKGVTIDSLLSDGLHPNDSGYEVMYKIITKYIGLNRKRPGATW